MLLNIQLESSSKLKRDQRVQRTDVFALRHLTDHLFFEQFPMTTWWTKFTANIEGLIVNYAAFIERDGSRNVFLSCCFCNCNDTSFSKRAPARLLDSAAQKHSGAHNRGALHWTPTGTNGRNLWDIPTFLSPFLFFFFLCSQEVVTQCCPFGSRPETVFRDAALSTLYK